MATFKKIRQVTLPVFKIEKNKERFFYIATPMELGKAIDDKEAPQMCVAVDLETGEEGRIIVPAVMKKELEEQYPSEAYVGRCFSVVLTRVPEKRYNIVSLSEVAAPVDFVPPPVRGAEVNTPAAATRTARK